jgi:hypothetical protein
MLSQKETELISEFLAQLEEAGLKKIEVDVNESRFDSELGPRLLVTIRLARKLDGDQKST